MTEENPDYLGHRARLKERFLKGNGRDMADYELLELLLTYAIPRRDVKPLAKKMLQSFGTLAEVVAAPDYRLKDIKGIKDSTLILLKLLKVVSERLSWQNLASDDKPIIFSMDSLIEYCRTSIAYSDVEELYLIYLDSDLHIIDKELFQKGSVSSVTASPREIIKHALHIGSTNIIMVHNHPSGSPRPSENDLKLTRMIEEACLTVNIKMQDHLIITKSDYFSFLEHQLLLKTPQGR